jgi:hypothetical protein
VSDQQYDDGAREAFRSEEARVPDRPAPTVLGPDLYRWSHNGTHCPDCTNPIHWSWDGYLFRGVCGCPWRHVSMAERVWPKG